MEADRARQRRALWASFVGTGIEFYDFYIYATAASLVASRWIFQRALASYRSASS